VANKETNNSTNQSANVVDDLCDSNQSQTTPFPTFYVVVTTYSPLKERGHVT